MMAGVFSNKTNVWRSSSWNDFLSHREPLHVTWYCCTWWTPAHTTERRSLKSSTSSMVNCNQREMSRYGFQIITFTGVSLSTGETRPVWRQERKDTKIEHPENQQQREGPTIPPINLCKPNTCSHLLRRTSRLWANGVPPFHATQDSVTLSPLPSKELRRSIISLPCHTIKSVGVATQVTGSGLGYEEPIFGLSKVTARLLACQ